MYTPALLPWGGLIKNQPLPDSDIFNGHVLAFLVIMPGIYVWRI